MGCLFRSNVDRATPTHPGTRFTFRLALWPARLIQQHRRIDVSVGFTNGRDHWTTRELCPKRSRIKRARYSSRSTLRVIDQSRPLSAWSVSLNPTGGNYAATGGSGNVLIHSAQPDNFGEHLATLSTGRSKFGMYCTHVGVCRYQCRRSPGRARMKLSTSCIRSLRRVQTGRESPCLRKRVRYTYSTLNPIPSHQRIHLTQCLYDRSLGLLIARFVFDRLLPSTHLVVIFTHTFIDSTALQYSFSCRHQRTRG
jgi:hypothetical protein